MATRMESATDIFFSCMRSLLFCISLFLCVNPIISISISFYFVSHVGVSPYSSGFDGRGCVPHV